MDENVNGLVSDHAARRYLEIALGVAPMQRGNFTDRGWLLSACSAAGLDAAELKRLILGPTVRAAIAAGASRVAFSTHTVAITRGADGTRFVVDVMGPGRPSKKIMDGKGSSRR